MMKYILADKDNNKVNINYITTDPITEVSKFEPIDVVNGELFAWDLDGNLYYFNSLSDVDTAATIFWKPVSVGMWREGEPIMTKVSEGHEDDLRRALTDYLQSPSYKERRVWPLSQRSRSHSLIEHSKMTLKELVNLVEERLKEG